MKCIKCDQEATIRFSPDLDIKGIGSCDQHKAEIKLDILIATLTNWDKFEKNILKINRRSVALY